jgi:hypothetical protein
MSTTANDRSPEALAPRHTDRKGPDRLEDVRERARVMLGMLDGELVTVRCVDWGTVTFAADGTAFVEAVIEVPSWAVRSDSNGGENESPAVADATGTP